MDRLKLKTKVLKRRLKECIAGDDFDGAFQLAARDKRVVSALTTMIYDKKSQNGWQAIHFLGKIIGKLAEVEYEFARESVRKLMWSANDESGGYGCSIPETLGEAIRENAPLFLDIIPLLISYYQDEIFRPGVLYAIGRIGERFPKQVEDGLPLVIKGLDSPDPEICAHAIIAAKRLGIAVDKRLMNRDDPVDVYLGNKFFSISLGNLAKSKTLADLS